MNIDFHLMLSLDLIFYYFYFSYFFILCRFYNPKCIVLLNDFVPTTLFFNDLFNLIEHLMPRFYKVEFIYCSFYVL